MNKNEIYNALFDKNGKDNQIFKAIEEMAELTKELAKFSSENEYVALKHIYDEIADVQIMIDQLKLIFDAVWIDKIIDFKLSRIEALILNG